MLTTAHHLLQTRAAAIEDERLRRCFLKNIPAHQELVQAHDLKVSDWKIRE